MSKKPQALAGAVACFLLAGSGTVAAEEPATITVDVGRPGAAINRHILGQCAEHLGRGVYEEI